MRHGIWLLVSVLVAAPAAGEVYRWVDEDGRVHYGDRPEGAGAQEKTLDQDAPVSSGSDARKRRRQRTLDAFERERRQREAERERADERARKRERRCAVARDRLRRYREAGTLYDLAEDGSRRVLSDDERARATEEARAAVERWCE